jgi:protein-S-isoprenylcysteine O-methyltransferase Ste14
MDAVTPRGHDRAASNAQASHPHSRDANLPQSRSQPAAPLEMLRLDARVPPLLVLVAAALAMWVVAIFAEELRITVPARTAISTVLIVCGVLICLSGFVEFRRARTTVDPTKPEAASTLVSSGIYRFTRNPMYIGFALALMGWAVFLENPVTLTVVVAFVAYIDRFQIRPEERALEARFGEQFSSYVRKVRRWL